MSPAGPSEWPGTGLSEAGHLQWLAGLTETYDRGVLGKDPPANPTTNAELILAGVVVLPELIALVELLISTRDWRRRDLLVLLLIFLSGLASLGGAIALALREAAGARWRAAGVRTRLDTDPVGRGESVIGKRALRTELLVLAARTGYRPAETRRVAVALGSTYLTVSVAVAGCVWWLRRVQPTTFTDLTGQFWGGIVGGHTGGGGGTSSDGGGDGALKARLVAAAVKARHEWQPSRWLPSLWRGRMTPAPSSSPPHSVTPSSAPPAAAASPLPLPGSSRGPVRRFGGGARTPAAPAPSEAATPVSPRPASE